MRRRLLNQTAGDPAQAALAALDAAKMRDIARLPNLQPSIISRRERERVTELVKEHQNGAAVPRGSIGSLVSSRAGALPPSPPAPRSKLSLKR